MPTGTVLRDSRTCLGGVQHWPGRARPPVLRPLVEAVLTGVSVSLRSDASATATYFRQRVPPAGRSRGSTFGRCLGAQCVQRGPAPGHGGPRGRVNGVTQLRGRQGPSVARGLQPFLTQPCSLSGSNCRWIKRDRWVRQGWPRGHRANGRGAAGEGKVSTAPGGRGL